MVTIAYFKSLDFLLSISRVFFFSLKCQKTKIRELPKIQFIHGVGQRYSTSNKWRSAICSRMYAFRLQDSKDPTEIYPRTSIWCFLVGESPLYHWRNRFSLKVKFGVIKIHWLQSHNAHTRINFLKPHPPCYNSKFIVKFQRYQWAGD